MPGQNLTRLEAAERSATVRTQSYDVVLDLTRGETVFGSTTTARFTATPGSSTFIDLVAPTVRSITLNGTPLDPAEVYADSRIALKDLAADNELVVVADCAYMHTGEGLHRFTDPADGETYLYSQFEVPDSRRVFAVFEQPDLKASFTFTVTAPSSWTVLSNSPTPDPTPTKASDGSGDAHIFAFAPTEPMSSYVTAIVAGPYVGATDEYVAEDGRTVPLGVYCRKSLVEHMDSEEILDLTKRGFAYYEDLFATPYAFTKYDQIFVPEFNAGAMENAGCVTHRDDYIFRSRPVEARVERRAVTILHELAHMWFGDMVTMTVVERPVAQRVLCRVHLHPGHRRDHPLEPGLDNLPDPGEGVGLQPGPAVLHPPRGRGDPRPARRRGQLRRNHLRQGGLGPGRARGIRGP